VIDGQIIGGKVWYGFDAQQLEWLYKHIPNGDVFKNTVARGMQELRERPSETKKPLHPVDFSRAELLVLKRLAQSYSVFFGDDPYQKGKK